MLSLNMLIENLRQDITIDSACLQKSLEDGQRLIKMSLDELTEDDYELMDILHGQLQHAAKRMQFYDRRWYELHGDLSGLDDYYKIIYHSKNLFQKGSPMFIAALCEDTHESLRARMAHWRRREQQKISRASKPETNPKMTIHTLSVQYSSATPAIKLKSGLPIE